MTKARGTGWFAACFSAAMLAALPALAHDAGNASGPARTQNVSIQVVNPDAATGIRLRLDGQVIFDAVPLRSSINNIPSLAAVAGSFPLSLGSKHELTAEVPGAATRAQLVWTTRLEASPWIVVYYYPGRPDENIPPFFTMALQDYPHKLR